MSKYIWKAKVYIGYNDTEKYKVNVLIKDIPYSRSYKIHKTDYSLLLPLMLALKGHSDLVNHFLKFGYLQEAKINAQNVCLSD